jgi:tetratricopeptide (TPR) repeat protein
MAAAQPPEESRKHPSGQLRGFPCVNSGLTACFAKIYTVGLNCWHSLQAPLAESMNKQTEQLEKNELIEWLDQKFGHLRPYASQIVFGIVALIALSFAAAFFFKSRADLQASQWQNLNSAINTFALDRQTSHLLNMAEEYPDVEASMWALQLAGDVEMRNGLSTLNSDTSSAIRNLEKAKKAYEKLLESPVKKSPDLIQRATYSLGFCLESLGEFDEAKKIYQKVIDEAGSSVYGEPSRLALARLAQPEIVAFYEAYKRTAVAPVGELPKRPDISFPELGAESGSGEAGSTEPAPAAETPAAETPAADAPAAEAVAEPANEKAAEEPAKEGDSKDGGGQ